MAHAGYKAWGKAGNLHFPEKSYTRLREIVRNCAGQHPLKAVVG
ncbi:hypothetical protein [Cupriavidus lacunae]|nr:hypothetical protein [Cupriavidus lacunae]